MIFCNKELEIAELLMYLINYFAIGIGGFWMRELPLILAFIISVPTWATVKKPCEEILVDPNWNSEQANGVYTATIAEGFKQIENNVGPDDNIFHLIQERLGQPQHIIDWGSGSGRMLKFYRNANPKWITLVEPSSDFIDGLKLKTNRAKNEVVIQGSLGDNIERNALAKETLHTVIFVINCMETTKLGLNALWNSMLPSESAMIATNVFIPKTLASNIYRAHGDFVPTPLGQIHLSKDERPKSKTFFNEIIAGKVLLTDAVQPIDDVESWIKEQGENIAVSKTGFLSPVGFRLKKNPGDDFGDYDFVVLWLEFQKLK